MLGVKEECIVLRIHTVGSGLLEQTSRIPGRSSIYDLSQSSTKNCCIAIIRIENAPKRNTVSALFTGRRLKELKTGNRRVNR